MALFSYALYHTRFWGKIVPAPGNGSEHWSLDLCHAMSRRPKELRELDSADKDKVVQNTVCTNHSACVVCPSFFTGAPKMLARVKRARHAGGTFYRFCATSMRQAVTCYVAGTFEWDREAFRVAALRISVAICDETFRRLPHVVPTCDVAERDHR